jgi:uncharacterized protein (DUF2062 family)
MIQMDDTSSADQCALDDGAVRAGWRVRLMNLLTTADTPHRTAAAFAWGVFLSFSPFLGLQILLGLGAAMLFRLNRVVVFAGLCTNLPWIMVPWYTFTTLIGAAALGVDIRDDIGAAITGLLELPIYRWEFWTRSLEILAPFFWSFVVGSSAGALVIGLATYVMVSRTLLAVRVADGRA